MLRDKGAPYAEKMAAFVVGPDEGERYELRGGEVIVKAMPGETDIGGFSVEMFPAGFATPEPVHHRDDGVFYILEGSMRVKCGDLDSLAGAGAMIFLPKGVPHAFRVEGDAPVRWFNVQSPHGDFMLGAKEMAVSGAAGGDAAIELLGPPPF